MEQSKVNAYRAKHKRCKYCIYRKESCHYTFFDFADINECVVKKHYWIDAWFNGLRGMFCSVFKPEPLDVNEREGAS